MLTRLSISNYALISSLDITFPDGLIIITGETGAGKSILLGAISLLLGKKADASVFSDPARNCVVEAEFLDKESGKEYILRRVVAPSGRSRSFLNDEPVTLAELTSISSRIIDIHEQHRHLLLTAPEFRLEVIDRFADVTGLLGRYREAYEEYEAKAKEIEALENEIARADADADYRQFQLDRLNEAMLVPGETEALEEEHRTLAHAEDIRSGLEAAYEALNPQGLSIVHQLKDSAARLARYASYDSRLQPMADRLESCRIEVSDIEHDIGCISSGITVDPGRLEAVEERISKLTALMRKYSRDSVEGLIELRDSLQASVCGTEKQRDRLETLEKELAVLDSQRRILADELSERRRAACGTLSAELQSDIRSLEMPHAVFDCVITPKHALDATGGDNLDFLFSANGSASLQDISKVASGGELSRVMLALKGLMARYTALPTMIFDEIDTGVSGRIADRMGDMIGRMGERMQIFAITHLPQIASKRGTHYQVYKEFGKDGNARTLIRRLDGEDRVMEVARMLSGSELTAAAVENARELLSAAGNR